MKKVVILTSGGMDSTTLLHYHKKQGDCIRAIAFNYGQRHAKELEYAMQNAKRLEVPFQCVDLSSLAQVLPGSSQTDMTVSVPEGHYAEDSMRTTVVPNRNMILLAIATGHAIAHHMDFVSYAAHAGDHAVYPDCRPKFTAHMARIMGCCDWKKVKLLRLFIKISKADIVKIGLNAGVDFSQTWSCYKGGDIHCGRCGTCIERREAFHLAGVTDPTTYAQSAPTVDQMIASGWKL